MDLNHGVAFSGGNMEIYAGEYTDCCNADLVVLTAGLPQKEGQNRLDLLKENRKIFETILQSVLENGFHGIFLVATNPVDIMTRIVYEISDFPPEKVIGTGTALDTARLRYLLGEKFMIDPRNMHAYVMGEHGDSEFVPWSQAMMTTKPIFDLCGETEGCHFQELLELEEEVRMAAYKIIEAKRQRIMESVWQWHGLQKQFLEMNTVFLPYLHICRRIRGKWNLYRNSMCCKPNGNPADCRTSVRK